MQLPEIRDWATHFRSVQQKAAQPGSDTSDLGISGGRGVLTAVGPRLMRSSGRFRPGRVALLAFLLPLSCKFSQAAAYLACSGIGAPLGLRVGQQMGKGGCETPMSQSVSQTLLQQHGNSQNWQRRSSPHLKLSLSLNAGGLAGSGSLPADEPGEWSSEGRTEFIAECQLPTDKGLFRLRSYRYRGAKVPQTPAGS